MTDTAYKPTLPGRRHSLASSRRLSAPAEFTRTPAAAASRSQDTNFTGRRALLVHHTGGAAEFAVSNATPTALVSPDGVTWRTLAVAMEPTTAGTVLEVRCLSVPSGAKVLIDGGLPSVTVGGEARLIFTWHHKDGSSTTTKTAQLEIAPASAEVNGVEQAAQGAAWAQFHHSKIDVVRPDGAANVPATRALWSEVSTVKIELQVRGGARLFFVGVSEVPLDHAAADDDDDISLTGVASGLAWPNKRPQQSDLDGATFEEHRFGIHQAQRVAVKQTTWNGPAVARWSSYTGDGTAPIDADPAAKVITVSGATTGATPTMERVSGGTNTTWDRDSPGHWIMGVGQQPDARRQMGRGPMTYSTMRVRGRVHCRFASVGAGVGLFRIQSGPESWINIRPDRGVIGITWTWIPITGSLVACVATDDTTSGAPYALVQDFASRGTSAANLEIRYWTVSYGDVEGAYLGQ